LLITVKSRFPALRNRSFRSFWLAQAISLPGTWMQNLALPWLAYTLTGSPFLLGLVGAVQFLPVMFLSLFAGALTDRLVKARVVFVTQSVLTASSALLATLVFTHTATYPILLVVAFVLGLANTMDMPSRQAMVGELVGQELVMNAVALNSSLFNASRIVGPALAGVVMGAWGIGWCFAINSLSFLPLLVALTRLPKVIPPVRTKNSPDLWQAVKEGIRFVRHDKPIREVLVAVAIMGILGFNFSVILPVLVKKTFSLGETDYGLLMSCMGVGSLIAALTLATRSRQGPRKGLLLIMPLATAALFVALAFAPWIALVQGLMVLVGFSNVAFFTTANSFLQVNSPLEYRGRVIAFYALLFSGTTPFGNLISGTLVEVGGSFLGFLVTGLLLLGCFLVLRFVRGRAESRAPIPSPPPGPLDPLL
jgi:MFS family permease